MLSLSCLIHLESHEINELMRPTGAVFTRWLPDGRNDAITVTTRDTRNRLEFWFERRGYVQDSFVRYDPQRQEVDVAVMRRQGQLDSGPLLGEGYFVHATNAELVALRADQQDSTEYVNLGKRVIDFLSPPLIAFVDRLRIQYGQHWLPELRPWDSRRESLGSYCSSLRLRWRETPDADWRDFRPTPLVVTIRASVASDRDEGQYLTESDWRTLQSSFDPLSPAPLALRVIARAHELRDTGQISEAIVQGVTAVELAMEYFLTVRLAGKSKAIQETVTSEQFLNLPLKIRLSVLAIAANLMTPDAIEAANEAIDVRNTIVHEGSTPEDRGRRLFRSLAESVKAFVGFGELKTPSLSTGNRLSEPGQTP
jgi:hypothetical protein